MLTNYKELLKSADDCFVIIVIIIIILLLFLLFYFYCTSDGKFLNLYFFSEKTTCGYH